MSDPSTPADPPRAEYPQYIGPQQPYVAQPGQPYAAQPGQAYAAQPGQAPYVAQPQPGPYVAQPQPAPYGGPPTRSQGRGLSVTALVIGIASLGLLLLATLHLTIDHVDASFPLAVAALAFAIAGLVREPRGRGIAITGLVLGGLVLLVKAVAVVVGVALSSGSLLDFLGGIVNVLS
jgi:hypothetical protein